jgi:hypothetical protein
MKTIRTSLLLVLILVGVTSILSAEELRYDGTIAGRPITFWIDWKSDGKLAGTYWFDGHSQSFLGSNYSEGVMKLTDDDSDQMVLTKVLIQGRVIWKGVVRGGQFDGEVVEISRAMSKAATPAGAKTRYEVAQTFFRAYRKGDRATAQTVAAEGRLRSLGGPSNLTPILHCN